MPGCCVCTPSDGWLCLLPEGPRDSYVRRELLTQRSFQIVAGYEDCNDADSLRSDPIFKTVCDRLPESDPDLASQPTLSRLENSVDEGSHSPRDLLEAPQEEHHPGPETSKQEFSFYQAIIARHVSSAALFDGETGDLVCALLRQPGGGRPAVAVLKRVPEGSGRCSDRAKTPALYEFCEEEKLQYVVGFARNSRLAATVEPLVEQVQADYDDSGEKQRQFTELVYQADSWDRERRIGQGGSEREPSLCGHLTDVLHRTGPVKLRDRSGHGSLELPPFPGQPVPIFIHGCRACGIEAQPSAAAWVPGFGKLLDWVHLASSYSSPEPSVSHLTVP